MFNGMKIGVGITGSFCSLSNCLRFLKELKKYPVDIYVFISDQVNSCDTRFFKANQFYNTFFHYFLLNYIFLHSL